MPDSPWQTAARFDPSDLVDAFQELHHATQLLAAAGQAFAAPEPDDSHRAAVWDGDKHAFVGADFSGTYPFRVALRPRDLTLLVLERSGDELGALHLEGESLTRGYDWLADAAATYMGRGHTPIEPPDFDIPGHAVARGEPFRTDVRNERLAVEAIYAAADGLLQRTVAGHENAEPVRVWPHHFDIGSLFTVRPPRAGDRARTVGFGMAPMGGGYDHWYWYVNIWPAPEPDELPPLEPWGWHTEGWVGSVLSGEAIAAKDEEGHGLVQAFLRDAIGTAVVFQEERT